MSYFKPSEYDIKIAISDIMRYTSVTLGDNYVFNDHGDYIEVCVDANNKKGHIIFDIYYDATGKITSVCSHPSN